MRRPDARPAFTLTELLLVMFIMIVLATLTVVFGPRVATDQRTSRGADQLQGWIFVAKQRAFRDNVPRGVRLVRNADNPNYVTELMYIEQPEDYKGGIVMAPSPYPTNPPSGPFQMVSAFLPGRPELATDEIIQPGDFLYLMSKTYPNRISAVTATPPDTNFPNGGTQLMLGAADGTLPVDILVPVQTSDFRIVRQARPMVGEPNLKLPRDVAIDLSPSPRTNPLVPVAGEPIPDGGYSILAGGSLDILFNARGLVMGSNAVWGKAILRVRDVSRPTDVGDQTLITIYTRSGQITAHPVDTASGDPYSFTKDGKSSGL